MNDTKYDYRVKYNIDEQLDLKTAIEHTILNYLHIQLGWTIEDCKKRVLVESNREIPKGIFNHLEKIGWNFKAKKIIDIGSGQGGAVLEALYREADAYGIEPGDEFAKLSRMRLKEAGFDKSKIIQVSGDKLPFENDFFDYVVSLQVLEHVNSPQNILDEFFRVLKPGGECYISCENYLSFREQHYRIFWLPLLPKFLGSIYLRLRKRNPDFFKKYVFYTTYPQIWRLVKKVGFNNITYNNAVKELLNKSHNQSRIKNLILSIIKLFPNDIQEKIVLISFHIRNFYKVGVSVLLEKPIKK